MAVFMYHGHFGSGEGLWPKGFLSSLQKLFGIGGQERVRLNAIQYFLTLL
jgi:hypothetical protein